MSTVAPIRLSIRSAAALVAALGVLALLALGGGGGGARADDAPEKPVDPPKSSGAATVPAEPPIVTWDGYLWRSREGWLQVGIPLVSEQFVVGAPRVVEAPLADRLADGDVGIARAASEQAFWYGTALADPNWEPQRLAEPRTLVRLRGRTKPTIVHLSLVRTTERESPISLVDARLLSVERIDPAWLAAWRPIFTTPGSPWLARKDGVTTDSDVRKAFVKVAADALAAMRAVPVSPPSDAAKAVDPSVHGSTKFRHRVEFGIQRHLVAEAKELHVALPTSLALPDVPPSSDAARWLADAETRAAFLERAKANWRGDPEDLELAYYEDDGKGSRWQEHADVETIENAWTDARYVAIRATLDAMKPAR